MEESQNMKGHIIICGFGATAVHLIEALELLRKKTDKIDLNRDDLGSRDYLVIDSSEAVVEKMKEKWPHLRCVIGDATDDDILEQAFIRDAYGIFPVLSSEKDNLYITMASRQLNPRIRIVARTADIFNIGKKLFKGGANSVVSPNFMGGLRIVSEIARPNVTDFLDELLHETNLWLQIAEIVINPSSPLAGMSLKESGIPEKYGMNVIALKKGGAKYYTYNPKADERIQANDTVVVLGYRNQIIEIRKLSLARSNE